MAYPVSCFQSLAPGGLGRGLLCSWPGGADVGRRLPPLLFTSLRPHCQEAGNAGAHVVSQESSRRQTRSTRVGGLQPRRDSTVLPAHLLRPPPAPRVSGGAATPQLLSLPAGPVLPGLPTLTALSPSALPTPPGPVHLLFPPGERPALISAPGRPQAFAQMPPLRGALLTLPSEAAAPWASSLCWSVRPTNV